MSQEEEKNKSQYSEDTKEQFPTLSSPGSSDEADDDSTELLGSVIGDYKLLSELGKGGFGIVYLAEQIQPVTRQVALKIIKLGMDTKQVIARFEAERQALAMMDHPNIAHIYDGGTTKAGRPYFVMEYFEGTPITEYCDEQKLCIKERLELFEQVCRAAQHAHHKGIIHRDIKPSNVLVSLQDDKPVPKIIDFGIAKAVSQSSTERTFTEHGQFVGTPEYMSPEQATLTNQDIDTRSDIYSLGVLLYELLTGTLPFESSILHQTAFDERLRIIREEDPPFPSTRLSSLGEEAQKIAQCRQTEVSILVKRLHKELEWIPLMAMRKERTRRYQSASEFAQDIRNYLNGDPLKAGPESRTYRLKKTIKRHRVVVTGAAVVLLVLIAGIVASTIFAVRAQQEKLKTERESEARRRALYVNQIALAEKEIEEGEFTEAQGRLDECDLDLRSWEWLWLSNLSQRTEYTIKSDKACYSATFGPDGKRLALLDGRGLRILDLSSGQHVLAAGSSRDGGWDHSWDDDWNIRVAFSPDGKRVAEMVRGDLVIYDSESGKALSAFQGPSMYADFVFLPTGECVVAVGGSNAGVWDIDNGRRIAAINLGDSLMRLDPIAVRVAVVSTSDPNKIEIWDVPSCRRTATLEGNAQEITCLSFSPDGSLLASGDLAGTITIWNLRRRHKVTTLTGHLGPISDIAFSPDGTMLASVASNLRLQVLYWNAAVRIDKSVRIWEVSSGQAHTIMKGHDGQILSVAYDQTGLRLATSAMDGTVRVWDISPKPITVESSQKVKDIFDFIKGFLAFTEDGQQLVVLRREELRVLDVKDGHVITKTSVSTPDVLSSWPALTQNVFACRAGNSINLLDLHRPGEIQNITLGNLTLGVSFAQDGSQLYCVSRDKVDVVDVPKKSIIGTIKPPPGAVLSGQIAGIGGGYLALGIQGDASSSVGGKPSTETFQHVLVLDQKGKPLGDSIWDPPFGGRMLYSTEDGGRLVAVASELNLGEEKPDRRRIAEVLSTKSRVAFWQIGSKHALADRQETKTLDGWVLAVSPLLDRIVCVDGPAFNDGFFRIVDSTTGHRVIELRHKFGAILSAAFSPDGQSIATLGSEGSVVFWSTTGMEPKTVELGPACSPGRKVDSGELEDSQVYTVEASGGGESISEDLGNISQEQFEIMISAYTKRIEVNPMEWGALYRRGVAYYRSGQYDQAISDIGLAIQIEPERGYLWHIRGLAHFHNGQYARSISDFDKAIEIDPNDFRVYHMRARVHVATKQYEQAVSDLTRSFKIGMTMWEESEDERYERDLMSVAISLARVYATCPQDSLRNGPKALELAYEVCVKSDELEPMWLDTLAAVYADCGDFESAVEWQKKAIDLHAGEDRTKHESEFNARLKLYQSGKPYREKP